MNAKELSEIKKHLKWDDSAMNIICLQEAYGKNGDEGAKLFCRRSVDFSLMDEEEGRLYLEILKKSLSGTLGKNLMEFRFETGGSQESETSVRARLYNLKNGDLKDEKIFEELALEILAKGDYRNPVHITGVLCEYAAPDYNSAGEVNEGSSSFRFLILAVCQARLTEIGLIYSYADNEIKRKINDEMEILPSPLDALLYPVFTERASDVNHILYHCQKPKTPNIDLIENFLSIPFDKTAPEQSDAFQALMAASFENRLDSGKAIRMHNQISEAIAAKSQEEGVVRFDQSDLRQIIELSGADDKTLELFDDLYPTVVEDQTINAVNTTEKGKLTIKAPSLSISVRDDALARVKTMEVDGQPCLVIALEDDMEIGGLPVSLSTVRKQ